MNTRGMSLGERIDFYSIPVPHCGCHIWTGGTTKNGYGVCATGGQDSDMAHRVAWSVANGPIPQGMHVLHRCDMPSCVNPDHLFIGTNRDNVDDKVQKGRAFLGSKVDRRGSRNSAAKLSDQDVAVIRASTETCTALATRYRISKSTTSRIKRGISWRAE